MMQIWFLLKIMETGLGTVCLCYHIGGFNVVEPLPHNLLFCGTFFGFTLLSFMSAINIAAGGSPPPLVEFVNNFIAASMYCTASIISMNSAENDFHLMYLSDFEEPEHRYFANCRSQSIAALATAAIHLLHTVLAFDVIFSPKRTTIDLRNSASDYEDDEDGAISDEVRPIKMYFMGKKIENQLRKFAWFDNMCRRPSARLTVFTLLPFVPMRQPSTPQMPSFADLEKDQSVVKQQRSQISGNSKASSKSEHASLSSEELSALDYRAYLDSPPQVSPRESRHFKMVDEKQNTTNATSIENVKRAAHFSDITLSSVIPSDIASQPSSYKSILKKRTEDLMHVLSQTAKEKGKFEESKTTEEQKQIKEPKPTEESNQLEVPKQTGAPKQSELKKTNVDATLAEPKPNSLHAGSLEQIHNLLKDVPRNKETETSSLSEIKASESKLDLTLPALSLAASNHQRTSSTEEDQILLKPTTKSGDKYTTKIIYKEFKDVELETETSSLSVLKKAESKLDLTLTTLSLAASNNQRTSSTEEEQPLLEPLLKSDVKQTGSNINNKNNNNKNKDEKFEPRSQTPKAFELQPTLPAQGKAVVSLKKEKSSQTLAPHDEKASEPKLTAVLTPELDSIIGSMTATSSLPHQSEQQTPVSQKPDTLPPKQMLSPVVSLEKAQLKPAIKPKPTLKPDLPLKKSSLKSVSSRTETLPETQKLPKREGVQRQASPARIDTFSEQPIQALQPTTLKPPSLRTSIAKQAAKTSYLPQYQPPVPEKPVESTTAETSRKKRSSIVAKIEKSQQTPESYSEFEVQRKKRTSNVPMVESSQQTPPELEVFKWKLNNEPSTSKLYATARDLAEAKQESNQKQKELKETQPQSSQYMSAKSSFAREEGEEQVKEHKRAPQQYMSAESSFAHEEAQEQNKEKKSKSQGYVSAASSFAHEEDEEQAKNDKKKSKQQPSPKS